METFLKDVGRGAALVVIITLPAVLVFLLIQSLSHVAIVSAICGFISAILANEFLAKPLFEHFETDPETGLDRKARGPGFLVGVLIILALLCSAFWLVIRKLS